MLRLYHRGQRNTILTFALQSQWGLGGGSVGTTLEISCNCGKSPVLLFREAMETTLSGFSPVSSLQRDGSVQRENFLSTSCEAKVRKGLWLILTEMEQEKDGKREARGSRGSFQAQVTPKEQIPNWLWQKKRKINFVHFHSVKHPTEKFSQILKWLAYIHIYIHLHTNPQIHIPTHTYTHIYPHQQTHTYLYTHISA